MGTKWTAYVNITYLNSFIVNKRINCFVSCFIFSLVHINPKLRPPLCNSKGKCCIHSNTTQWNSCKCYATLHTLQRKNICKDATNKHYSRQENKIIQFWDCMQGLISTFGWWAKFVKQNSLRLPATSCI